MRVLGIDLGTTNSVVATLLSGELCVVPDANGNRTAPSVVSYGTSSPTVGTTARNQASVSPHDTVYSVKRLMGRKLNDALADAARVSYEVISDENGNAAISVGDRIVLPEEVSSEILRFLKKGAEETLDEEAPLHFYRILTREEFERLTSEFLSRCEKLIEEALNAADVDKSEIDEVVLVGGSTRMPAITDATSLTREARKRIQSISVSAGWWKCC